MLLLYARTKTSTRSRHGCRYVSVLWWARRVYNATFVYLWFSFSVVSLRTARFLLDVRISPVSLLIYAFDIYWVFQATLALGVIIALIGTLSLSVVCRVRNLEKDLRQLLVLKRRLKRRRVWPKLASIWLLTSKFAQTSTNTTISFPDIVYKPSSSNSLNSC